ncbi:hypothetical protein [Streptosporangium lutulentum]|uniref:Cellulose biosynthesis protein BcsQ n=1 Tax=Streptosporangium lutulentum TaxID=1461250 RepID=A0ABT9QCF5_9ACTN|nr:hypothetical protein [Streptosporangium lutulentum]MDP9843609.1 cellulose biosynthesis protein BcsQ [Streptosporangium lutulentum]
MDEIRQGGEFKTKTRAELPVVDALPRNRVLVIDTDPQGQVAAPLKHSYDMAIIDVDPHGNIVPSFTTDIEPTPSD